MRNLSPSGCLPEYLDAKTYCSMNSGKSSPSSTPLTARLTCTSRKRAVMEELFKALLHKLMTGDVRVGELNLSEIKVN